MSKKEAPLEYLQQFIPPAAVPRVLEYLQQYRVHLTITRERKSILGDYRHATLYKTHRISVNGNLNPFSFLITLIHELAHLVTFIQYGNRVQSHGKEWKALYAMLLKDFMGKQLFPADVEQALQKSMHDLPASSCADENLMRILKNYDPRQQGVVMVEQLQEGQLFDIGEGRIFRKGKKLRKRYQCIEVKTGKLYLFSPIYEVKELSNAG
ncbi:SprT family zinc-dependent metalloprotease [Pseudoflavitalea sp. G-6-1-2]|uniref:SprT-like domain-containing protein n=1 Tax=Pseudoflavitalea sp. G-6-1-2 TaxID=2728841 RepID=UPI00146B870B|nr:SprT-like domain-containing protein [Pseudoflavitalea sp. G-6-1-2]NML22161.1 SprT family zinc-dependent metalloprotease [Pseudoflavitalea sp. G-6-1-2]